LRRAARDETMFQENKFRLSSAANAADPGDTPREGAEPSWVRRIRGE
jgi:hypothetical protein